MPQWQKNLYVLFVVQMVSMAGFSLVFPFLPLYVAELGVTSGGSLEFWAGLVFSSQAITMMLSAPVWGALADRHGRKLMLIRASLGGAVMIGLMGFAQSAEQLVLLRTIQGLLTGTIAAANAMIASATPRERSGEALGLLQMGGWIGIAVGPLIGGIIGDMVGFRESFWVTGILLGLAGLAVIFFVREEFTPVVRTENNGILRSYRSLLRTPDMTSLYSLSFLQTLGRSAILPIAALFVMSLMQSSDGVATITGLLMGANAFVGSISAVKLGRISDRIGHERMMLFGAILALVLYLPQPFVTAAWQLVLLQALVGFANGAMLPSLSALMNTRTSQGSQGATYGLHNSVDAAARMVAPMLGAGVAIWFGMRGVFGMAALVYGGAALVAFSVWRRSRVRTLSGWATSMGDD